MFSGPCQWRLCIGILDPTNEGYALVILDSANEGYALIFWTLPVGVMHWYSGPCQWWLCISTLTSDYISGPAIGYKCGHGLKLMS